MLVNFSTQDGESFALDLDQTMELENVAALIEAECSIPSDDQLLYFDGKILQDPKSSLNSVGVKDNAMIVIHSKSKSPTKAVPPPSSSSSSSSAGQSKPQLSSEEINEIESNRLSLIGNPDALAAVRKNFPDLADAAVSGDTHRFAQLLPQIQQRMKQAEQDEQRNIALLNADPFDVNAQSQIEEAIREQRVMENMAHALEFSPEIFGTVSMLYVGVEVNGTPVKAFVDSGAQTTIMNPQTAERCGIMRLLDKRFGGMARGVGTAKILGRVHSAQIKIGDDLFLPCSFTILEGDVELLFGLDMLKRYQACIDLQRNALVIQGRNVPFLPEHEIPKIAGAGDEVLSPPGLGPSSSSSIPTSATTNKPSQFQGTGQTLGGSTTKPTTTPSTLSSSQNTIQPSSGQQQQPQQQQGSKFPEETIQNIANLGVTREEAIRMLEATGGDAEQAASLLFSQLDGS